MPSRAMIRLFMVENGYKYCVLIDDGEFYVGYRPFKTSFEATSYAVQMQKKNEGATISVKSDL